MLATLDPDQSAANLNEAHAASPHYIYGLVASGHADPGSPATLAGLDGRAVGTLPCEFETQEGAINLVAGNRFAAIVSPIEDDEVEPTRRNLMAHTRILEAAMTTATVLPVRFGSIVPDLATLRRLLDEHADKLAGVEARLEGRIEVGLKARWDRDRVLREVVEGDRELLAMRERIQKKSENRSYYDRIDFGRRIEDAMQLKRDRLGDALMAALTPLAVEHVRLKPIDDTMVLNAAFLLERETEARLDAVLSDLADSLGAGLEMRYVGPVPPYNFVDLAIRWGG